MKDYLGELYSYLSNKYENCSLGKNYKNEDCIVLSKGKAMCRFDVNDHTKDTSDYLCEKLRGKICVSLNYVSNSPENGYFGCNYAAIYSEEIYKELDDFISRTIKIEPRRQLSIFDF